MRRAAASILGAVVGIIYGMVLALSCIYAVNLTPSPASRGVATGCHELGECPISFWGAAMLLLTVFGPAAVFAVLNAISWGRWPVRTWAARSGLVTLVIVSLYGILAV